MVKYRFQTISLNISNVIHKRFAIFNIQNINKAIQNMNIVRPTVIITNMVPNHSLNKQYQNHHAQNALRHS